MASFDHDDPFWQGECWLYRFFDASRSILYIGVSVSVTTRLAAYRRRGWGELITFAKLEKYPSRWDAMCAEARAIATEKPPHNLYFNTKNPGTSSPFLTDDNAASASIVTGLVAIDELGTWIYAPREYVLRCEQCGSEFVALSKGARFCNACATERNRRSIRKSQQRRRVRLAATTQCSD